jgi:hypothetical protein
LLVFRCAQAPPEDHGEITGTSPQANHRTRGGPTTTPVVKVFSSSENRPKTRSLELLHVDRAAEST